VVDKQTHQGGCHCGAVRFEARAAFDQALACNCSICQKRGHILAFVPASDFNLISGDGVLTDYQFGKKQIHHLFCAKCGVGAFGRGTAPDGTKMCAINVRCIDGIDVAALKIVPFDGKSL